MSASESSGPDFTIRHPHYAAMAQRWQMAMDFWRGGRFVLEPDHASSFFYSAKPKAESFTQTAAVDAEPARSALDMEWYRADSSSYLWRHSSESDGEYEERCARAVHLPVFSRVVDIYTAGILRTPPKRDEDSRWSYYHDDVDMAGTSYDAFIRESLAAAMVYGRVHAITDMEPAGEAAFRTKGEQQRSGARAYTYLVTPLELVDWRLDEYGRFLWAVIAEAEPDARGPGGKPKRGAQRYRVWTRDSWELWGPSEKRDRFNLVTSGKHPVGEVPIATLYTSRSRSMECESPFSDVLDGDRRLFNKYSEQDTLERYCGFPVLAIPEAGDKQVGPLAWGPMRAFSYDASAGGSPSWLSPDPTHARDGWARLIEQVFAFRFTSGASRSGERSLEERGAAAISAESEDKRNMMSAWAASVEEYDEATHRHANQWDDIGEPKRASYARNFDLRAIASQINDVVQLAQAKALPALAVAALVKPIVTKILAEHGETKETIGKVMAQIDSEAAKEKSEPAAPPPGSSFSGAMERSDRP